MSDIRLSALDLNLLVALDRLLATRSVSAAAREVGLSQPAMSRTLGRLREALGDPLLVRVGREMVPTERARELVEPVQSALAAVRRVFTPPEAFDPATATGDLVLALGDEAQHAFADAIVAALRAEAPGIDFRAAALTERTVEDGRRGRIHLALGPDLSALPASAGAVDLSDFVVRPLYRRRFVMISAPGRIQGPLDLEQYLAAGHVIVSFEAGGRGFVDDLLAERGLSRRVVASVTTFPSVARLVAATDLVATVPEEVATSAGVALDVHDSPIPLPELPMMLIWDPRHTAAPRHRFLRELVARAVLDRVASWAAG